MTEEQKEKFIYEAMQEYAEKYAHELREVIKQLLYLHNCEQEGIGSRQPTPEEWMVALERAERALR